MEDLIVHLEEEIYLSEPKLEVDQCGYASISNAIVTTTPTKKSTTRDVMQPWVLLTNQRYFWKTKNHIATSWVLFAPIQTSLSKKLQL
jgi:hypothetical protein